MDSRRQDASVQTSSTSMSGIPPVRRASLTELSPRARWWRWWWRRWLLFWWRNCDERQKAFSYIWQLFDRWPTMNDPLLQAEPKENNFKHLSIFALLQLQFPAKVKTINAPTITQLFWVMGRPGPQSSTSRILSLKECYQVWKLGRIDIIINENIIFIKPNNTIVENNCIPQRQPASEVDRTKPTKATKCLNVLLQVLIGYLIWSCSHLMAYCNLKSIGSSSSPAKGARIAKPVARQPVVPNSPR